MEIIFWLCFFLIAYTYLIYPALVIGLARIRPAGEPPGESDIPTVTMLIPAYNEEGIIQHKIANCLALEYPEDKLDFLFASDGSVDATAELLEAADNPRIRCLCYPEREGKTKVLNKLMPQAEGEILLFSDANSIYELDALRRLMVHFQEKKVGGVCGRLELEDPVGSPGGAGEGLYWRFENAIKLAEGRLFSVISANGAMFAVRRSLLEALPTRRAINDDFMLTLQVIQKGARVVYEPDAVARESTSPDMESEFQRKIRISSLNYNALPTLLPLLRPRYGLAALALFSHKLLRWLVPFLGAGLLAANLLLLGRGRVYSILLIGQGLVYLGALLGFLGDIAFDDAGPLIPFYYLAMVNVALVVGLWRSLTGTQQPGWQRVPH